MKSSFRPLLFTSLALFVGATTLAADDAVIPTLTLKNGRVFHHVKVLKVHPLTLNILADEGLAQVNKSSLPTDLAALYPADPAAAAAEQKAAETSAEVSRKLEEERSKQLADQQKRRAEEVEKKMVFNGCRIVSFVQDGDGRAIVEIHNESDLPVTLPGRSMVARSSENQVFDGRWVAKQREQELLFFREIVIPGHSVAKIPVLFNGRKQISITEVFWKPS